jgi:polysaccharide deacetylase family sporulation protein PdaB
MKLIILNPRKTITVVVITIAVVLMILTFGRYGVKALETFTEQRELPIYSVDTAEKKAAITFDCAWGADDIPEILKTLKEADIKATFFVVGQWAEKFPDSIKAIAADGHDVANHSYSHLRMGSIDRDRIISEIQKCNDVLEKLSGKKCDLFRAPYGDYNNSTIIEARKLGCYTIQWNVDSLDWKPGITQDEILRRIDKYIKPGSIILFHNDTPLTAKLLPKIIADLKDKGYSFVPVSELIMRDNYYMDNEGRQKSST